MCRPAAHQDCWVICAVEIFLLTYLLTYVLTQLALNNWQWLCLALENVQSELFDMKTKYDEAASAKYVVVQIMSISL